MAMGDPPRCPTCGMYETLSAEGMCNTCCTCEGAVSLATSTIAFNPIRELNIYEMSLGHINTDTGEITFSDTFLSALKKQLSEHKPEKEITK